MINRPQGLIPALRASGVIAANQLKPLMIGRKALQPGYSAISGNKDYRK
jgi:hypothetical protein